MLEIKAENVVRCGHQFDYELENGTLLHEKEWNGEVYTVRENGTETTYEPVYDTMPDENDGLDVWDIIGFERRN